MIATNISIGYRSCFGIDIYYARLDVSCNPLDVMHNITNLLYRQKIPPPTSMISSLLFLHGTSLQYLFPY